VISLTLFVHYRTLNNQSIVPVPSLNKTVLEKVMMYLTQAQDLYIVYTVNGTWKFKFKSYYTGEGRLALICFNCGKVEHGVRDCKEPRDQARIDKNVAEFQEKKQSQGNYRNKGPGGQAGGGYQRKTFTKTTGGEKQQLPARKTDLNNCPRETEPKHLPMRKSIKFGVRKSFMSAREKECNVYSRETKPQRPPTRK
jgi:hypothetical protein